MLVCENCGHENLLEMGPAGANGEADAPAKAEPEQVDPQQVDPEQVDQGALREAVRAGKGDSFDKRADTFGDKDQVRMWLREDALEALIPASGVGPRCRKCAHLLGPNEEHCSRCGLSRAEAERHAPGEAPWEQPPPGKESEHEQANLLWESFLDEPDATRLEKFVDFVRSEDLLDLGIRRLRFYLVDEPDDELVVELLRDLAESLQSRLIVATVQAKASANEFQEDVSRFKNRMVVAALVFWGGIFLLFLVLFWDNCSSGMPKL